MARMVAFLSNDPNRLRCAFHPYRDRLVVGKEDNHDGWGLGYFQHGEILLQKRPKGQGVEVRAADLVAPLHTDALILHVREATVGSWKHDNTHPFRFRSWLFAHRGTIQRFREIREQMAASIPEFLRRNIRGDTDSEYAFHLFLARIYEKGKLDDPNLDPRFVAGVLASAIAQLDDFVARAGGAELSKVNFVFMNGRVLVATRRGLSLHYLRREGIQDCAACRTTQEVSGRPSRVAHPLLRFVLVATDLREPTGDWHEVPESSVLTVNRNLETAVAPLAL
jgi:glutamine amidotransferase